MISVIKPGECWAELGTVELATGGIEACQNKGLGDMVQGRGNRLAPNLFAVSKAP